MKKQGDGLFLFKVVGPCMYCKEMDLQISRKMKE